MPRVRGAGPALALFCMLIAPWFSSGAIAAQASNELWPEMDVLWRPATHYRTYFQLKGQAEREFSKHEATVGLFQDYLHLPLGYVRAGYRYTFTMAGARSRESRLLGEGTLNRGLGKQTTFVNRTRAEFRWIDGLYSYRIRDRIHVEHETRGPNRLSLTPYASGEAFYDSRYKTIARLEGRLGSEFKIRGPVSVDVYYARQHNSRSSPSDVNALGIKLVLSY